MKTHKSTFAVLFKFNVEECKCKEKAANGRYKKWLKNIIGRKYLLTLKLNNRNDDISYFE